MKAGNQQRRGAAERAAQGQSLPPRGLLLSRFLVPASRALLVSASCLLTASSVWAANPAAAAPPAPHVSISKPPAVHPAFAPAPPVQAPRAAPAPPRSMPSDAVRPPQGMAKVQPRPFANPNPSPTPVPAYARPGYMSLPARPFAGSPNPGYPLQAQNNVRPPYPGQANTGEHLGSWMKQHQHQSLPEQERALRQEPGFSRLAPQQQQNLVNHLHTLDQMPAAQRQRTLNRIENMEHLSPERRQAVRSSAQQLGTLPENRKRLVKKAFRDLRDMPPEQRQSVMNSPQFAGQFSAQERSIMGNLLVVEPYQGPAQNQPQTQNGH